MGRTTRTSGAFFANRQKSAQLIKLLCATCSEETKQIDGFIRKPACVAMTRTIRMLTSFDPSCSISASGAGAKLMERGTRGANRLRTPFCSVDICFWRRILRRDGRQRFHLNNLELRLINLRGRSWIQGLRRSELVRVASYNFPPLWTVFGHSKLLQDHAPW